MLGLKMTSVLWFLLLVQLICLQVATARRRLADPALYTSGGLFSDIEEISTADVEENSSRRQLGAHLKASRTMAAAGPASAEEHRVTSLPGLSEQTAADMSHYAGLLQVDPVRDGNLFYWLIEKPKGAAEAPLVIWLNGT